jgi:(+)-pinoresinol hydroxylase
MRSALLWLPLLASSALAQPPIDGKQVFERSCAPCHREGRYMGGTAQLRANYQGTRPELLEQRIDLTPQYVKVIVRRGLNIMPRFRKTEVTDAELNAVAQYLSRNNSALAK